MVEVDIRQRRFAAKIIEHSSTVTGPVTAERVIFQNWITGSIVQSAAVIRRTRATGIAPGDSETIQGCTGYTYNDLITVAGIAGHTVEVSDDRRLAVVAVYVAAEDGQVGLSVALLALCFRPGKAAVKGHAILEGESGAAAR